MPRTLIHLLAGASVVTISLTAAAAQDAKDIGIADSAYSLEALIEAAKKEGPITVIDATGKIVSMADNFSKKYGLKATGVKMNGQDQEQIADELHPIIANVLNELHRWFSASKPR